MTQKEFVEILARPESSILDFKKDLYDFSNDKEGLASSKFVKDVISFTNTIRLHSAFIIFGVEEMEDNRKKLIGITRNIDDAILQDKVKTKLYPLPSFSYSIIQYNNLFFGILEFPIKRYNFPITSNVKLKGIEVGKIYFRQGSTNTEALSLDSIKINNWLQSLPVSNTNDIGVSESEAPISANDNLIDINKDIKESGLPKFEYFTASFFFRNGNFSVQNIFKELIKILNEDKWLGRRYFLDILDYGKRTVANSKNIIFEIALFEDGAKNHRRHQILEIKDNLIKIETSQYKGESDFVLTDLSYEYGAIVSLLIIINKIYKNIPFEIELTVSLKTNTEIILQNMQNMVRIIANKSETYTLKENISFNKTVKSMENNILIEIIEELSSHFIADTKCSPFNSTGDPFVYINVPLQNEMINLLKSKYYPAIEDL